MQKEKVPWNPWSILTRSCFPWTNDWNQSRSRSLSTMGCSCRWRSHLSSVRKRILLLQEQIVAPSQKAGLWHPSSEKTFWLQPSVVYLRTFTPRSWRRTIRAHSFLEEQSMAVGIEFVFYMVEMARFPGGLLTIQTVKEEASKSLGKERGNPLFTELWRKPQTCFSRIHSILLQIDRLQLTAVYCNRWCGVKTTLQKTRFRDEKNARIWDTDWVDDDRTQSDNNIQKKRTLYLESRVRGEMQLMCKTIPLNDETSNTNDNVKTKIQRNITTKHNTNTWMCVQL